MIFYLIRLAASLAAEEEGTLSRTEPSSSMVSNQKVDIGEEEKEEMMLVSELFLKDFVVAHLTF